MVLFTLNDAKHQRKKTQTLTLTLTVNRPLTGMQTIAVLALVPEQNESRVTDAYNCPVDGPPSM